MAYKLEDREGMASGVRRIVAEELDLAMAGLRTRPLSDQAVHEARKSLKKARSALRLLRSDLGNDVRRRETSAMRGAARRLSGARDAQVMLETLDKLAADPRVAVPGPAVARLKELLEARRAQLGGESDLEAEAAEAAAELAAVRERVDEWPLRDEGFAAAAAGLRRLHGQGRQAMDRALEKGDDQSWHEWRKRVKDLWYALRILKSVAPGQLSGPTDEASDLSDVLGDHNDLAVLAETVIEHHDELAPGHAELVRAALARRRDTLRLTAVPLGMRLYAERPKPFVRRLERCWHARDSQAAADAHWMPPELVGQVRGMLEAKQRAAPAERRKLSAGLRGLGFRVGDFEDHVPARRGGFSVEDFDLLVERGIVRVGAPPAPGSLAKGKTTPPPPEPASEPESAPRRESPSEVQRRRVPPQPSTADQLVRGGARLAAAAARWARRRLPV